TSDELRAGTSPREPRRRRVSCGRPGRACRAPSGGIPHGMKGLAAAASILMALTLFVLVGCEEVSSNLDPLSVNGRDGGIRPVNTDTLLRIGAAAHAGGDLPNALSLYRQAAKLDNLSP